MLTRSITSVTQNLSDGLRAVVMSGVGCATFTHVSWLIWLTLSFTSGRHVLSVPHIDSTHAGHCSTCITWCSA